MARLARSGYVSFVRQLKPVHSPAQQYVRYIQWFITFPLLLLSVLLSTGLSLSDIMTTLFMGATLVICGLVGALISSTYKWGFYVFGSFALFYVW